jgi:hypothetical protein
MKLLAKIGLFGVLAGATTALYADPVGGWLSPTGTGVSGGASATGSTDPARVGEVLSLPDVQMRAHQIHDQTRVHARHVQYLQEIARKEKNVIKLNCVNDKMVQLKPQMNLADAAESEIEGASDAGRMAAFANMTRAADSVRRLREEADQCIGESITQSGGESSNSFTGPKMPDDPTKGGGGFAGRPPIEAPIYASPFN